MYENITHIDIPEIGVCLQPGMRIKIGRFSNTTWVVNHGWFVFSGNRAICGWYLANTEDCKDTRPLQQSDLVDIYCVNY